MQALGKLTNDRNEHDANNGAEPPEDEAEQALAAFGLAPVGNVSQDRRDVYWLWPDNLDHWQAWTSIQTQWRYASSGMGAPVATGLDYAAVTSWLHHALGYKLRRLRDALQAIQACEVGALEGMAELRSKKK